MPYLFLTCLLTLFHTFAWTASQQSCWDRELAGLRWCNPRIALLLTSPLLRHHSQSSHSHCLCSQNQQRHYSWLSLFESQRASELDPPPRGRTKPQRGRLPEDPGAPAGGDTLSGRRTTTGPGQGPNRTTAPGAIAKPKSRENTTFWGHESTERVRKNPALTSSLSVFRLRDRVSPINQLETLTASATRGFKVCKFAVSDSDGYSVAAEIAGGWPAARAWADRMERGGEQRGRGPFDRGSTARGVKGARVINFRIRGGSLARLLFGPKLAIALLAQNHALLCCHAGPCSAQIVR